MVAVPASAANEVDLAFRGRRLAAANEVVQELSADPFLPKRNPVRQLNAALPLFRVAGPHEGLAREEQEERLIGESFPTIQQPLGGFTEPAAIHEEFAPVDEGSEGVGHTINPRS